MYLMEISNIRDLPLDLIFERYLFIFMYDIVIPNLLAAICSLLDWSKQNNPFLKFNLIK